MNKVLYNKVPATLLKGDSNKGVYLWNLRNFFEHLFLQNTSSGCFCNLEWLKRCSEHFLLWLYLKKRYVIEASKENEYLHHRLSTRRKNSINLKWIPPPRILRESAKLENNLHTETFHIYKDWWERMRFNLTILWNNL